MKRNVLKILVPVLVLALLLQVPFAFGASASALSEGTSYEFVVSPAGAGAAGDVEVKLFATTDSSELIDTFGATLVLDANAFDFVNKSGEVITSDYEQTSKQLGEDFALTATAVDEGEAFVNLDKASMVSYNSTSEQFYLFISGISFDGLTVDGKCELATFYLKSKEGVKPSELNMRKMELNEWKDACPSASIYPGEISSKDVIFVPAAENIVTDVTVTFNMPTNGSVKGGISQTDNLTATITVELFNAEKTYTTTAQGVSEYEIADVEAGTYTITISAPGALTFTINNVVVTADNQTVVPSIYLLFGDCNEDASITSQDLSMLLTELGQGGVTTSDVDGNGTVTAQDLGIILLADHFGYGADSQVINL